MAAKKDFAAAENAVEDAKRRIEDFELNTATKFAFWRTVKFLQDESEIELDKKKILFEDIKSKDGKQLIKFNGTPFVNIGTDTYNCQYGVDRNISTKKKKLNSKESDFDFRRHRFHAQNMKKHNCHAQIQLRDVIFFTDYKAKGNTEKLKRKVVKQLREDLSSEKSHKSGT